MSSTGSDDSSPSSSAEDHDANEWLGDIDVRRIQPVKLEIPHSFDNERPNRFEGPASTWQKYTRHERGLYNSLQQQEANDLSLHLYKVHGLKARLREHGVAPDLRPWSSRLRWSKSTEDGSRSWQPKPQWTAWPLHPDDVPRKDEAFGAAIPDPLTEAHVIRKPEQYIPSIDLQGELEALMLKHGRAQFQSREWTQAGDPYTMSIFGRDFNDTETAKSRDASDIDMGENTTKPRKPEYSDHFAVPTFLTDDDEASDLLQQPVRHIIARLDELLHALHKSKSGHHRLAAESPSGSRSKSVARSGSVGLGSQNLGSGTTDEPDKLRVPDVTARGRTNLAVASSTGNVRSHPRAASGHGLRDWSEVLGIATLVGWDVDVVDRAARRCASLFGETMVFRNMPETASRSARDELISYTPDMVSVDELATQGDSDASSVGSVTELHRRTQWFCPYEECARHDIAYDQGFRWREHLKKKHKHSTAEVEEIETALHTGDQHNRTGSKRPRLAAYPCLINSCNYWKHPFLIRHRWADHLRRSHKFAEEDVNDAERTLVRRQKALWREPSLATSHGGSSAMAENADVGDLYRTQGNEALLMVGGVHNDGFLELVRVNIYQHPRGKKRKTPICDEDEI